MNIKTKRAIINVRHIIGILIPCIFLFIMGLMTILTVKGILDPHYSWISAKATVTDIDKLNHTITISYVVNGNVITKIIESISSTVTIGNTYAIKINPSNFEDIYQWTYDVPASTIFIILGSMLMAVGVLVISVNILLTINKRRKINNVTKRFNLDYKPSFLFEFKPLNNKDANIYHFTPIEGDLKNFSVIDDMGKEYFSTQCLSKINIFSKTYQLIDYATRQTIIVKLAKNHQKNYGSKIPVKVDKKDFDDYFLERHVNYDVSYDEKKRVNIYNMYNGSNKIGEIYDVPSYRNVYMIKTMKENIDDIALFLLCLSYSKE